MKLLADPFYLFCSITIVFNTPIKSLGGIPDKKLNGLCWAGKRGLGGKGGVLSPIRNSFTVSDLLMDSSFRDGDGWGAT